MAEDDTEDDIAILLMLSSSLIFRSTGKSAPTIEELKRTMRRTVLCRIAAFSVEPGGVALITFFSFMALHFHTSFKTMNFFKVKLD